MKNLNYKLKELAGTSILGAFYTLWNAPIDEPKLKLPDAKKSSSSLFFGNLILGQKGT